MAYFNRSSVSSCNHPLAKGDSDDIPVPQALVDRIKVNNIIFQMKCSSQCTDHDKQSCKYCQSQEGIITEKLFLRSCKNRLEQNLLSSKVENHLLKQNSVTLIGNIAADLPKPSDKPNLIWQRLLKNEQHSTSDTNTIELLYQAQN